MAIVTVNPATGDPLRRYSVQSASEIQATVDLALRTFCTWRRSQLTQRVGLLRELGKILRQDRAMLASLCTDEMGKPVTQAIAEVEKCAAGCDYYADHGPMFLADERVAEAPPQRYVTYRPSGVLLAIMPWNFPYWQVYRVAVPAILAGNTMLLKHSTNVTGCALAIAETFKKAGFPPGVFQTLVVGTASVSNLVTDPRVAAVSFTGSTEVGRKIGAVAGAAMKKCVFELGGSDPYVVLADADLEHAAECCAAARLYNTGQSCVAAKRIIVIEEVRAPFEALLIQRLRSRIVGDPRSAKTDLGPLARADLRTTLHAQVIKSIRQGATLLLGGECPNGPGYYYPVTLLTGVARGFAAHDEEVFGPVASVMSAKDESEAIRMANDTPYGLGAAVFTADRMRGERIAREELDAGNAFVNEFVRSHPALPFGGTKQSGYGRELGSWGIREFTQAKVISVS